MTIPKRRDNNSHRERTRLRCPAHLAWVRGFECSVPSCPWHDPIEAAHIRIGTNGGMAIKPSDRWVISLCARHHKLQHEIGELAFAINYGMDMKALAEEFARKSPHWHRLRDMP